MPLATDDSEFKPSFRILQSKPHLQDEHIERCSPGISAAVSGVSLKGTVTGGRFLHEIGNTGYYVYSYASVGDVPIPGDSGSPVYTVPNTTDNVHVVGILTGIFYTSDGRAASFSSWNDVTQGLSLKPVGQ